MRVRFTRNRLWTPPEDRRLTVSYKADMELTVKRAWGEQMVKDGDAEEIETPAREPEKKAVERSPDESDGAAGGSLPKATRPKAD